jgi:hypothetical protein
MDGVRGARRIRKVIAPLRRFDCSHGELEVLAGVYESILNSRRNPSRPEYSGSDSQKPTNKTNRFQRRQMS